MYIRIYTYVINVQNEKIEMINRFILFVKI